MKDCRNNVEVIIMKSLMLRASSSPERFSEVKAAHLDHHIITKQCKTHRLQWLIGKL